jgi:DNA-binding CsgD family transcriptional regulator
MWRTRRADRPLAVALEIEDDRLAAELLAALAAHPAVRAAGPGETPAVIVADGPPPDETPGGPARLVVGDDEDAALPAGAPAALVLSAAHLLAEGFGLSPPADAAMADPESDSRRRADGLTPREREVVSLLVEGASNKQIARALAISPSTAKFHVAAILEKLGARNRADAVAVALREGVVAL